MFKTVLASAVLLSLSACAHAADPSPVYLGGGLGNASAKATLGYSFGEVPFPGGSFVNSLELVGFSAKPHATRANGIGALDALSFKFDNFALTARVGLGWTRTLDYLPRETAGLMAGLGASYALDQHWAVNLDVDRVPTRFVVAGKEKANLVTVGASYRF
jgi:opacity protein-like surface antigen